MEKNKLIKLTDSEYFKEAGYNFSTMKELLKSPLAFWYNLENPKEPTASMKLGTAVHCWLLEPLRFANNFISAPNLDKRTKEYKEFALENTDKFIYDAKEVEPIFQAIERSKGNFPGLDFILNAKTINEYCIFWDNYKCKIDAFEANTGTLIDVKTTSETDPAQFLKTIRKNAYHLQLAHYRNGLRACGYDVNSCRILAIQNTAPYDVVEYELDEYLMDYAEVKLDELYKKLDEVLMFETRSGASSKTIQVSMYDLGIY